MLHCFTAACSSAILCVQITGKNVPEAIQADASGLMWKGQGVQHLA